MEKENLTIKLGVLFYCCSILGYFYELLLSFIYKGKFISHGFLSGPWLPIYGTGSLLVMLIYKYRKKPLLIFILSFFITGMLEYISGLVLNKLFNIRLWNYKDYFLNINGYVCLLSAFCFGLGGLLITYLIYPFIEKIVKNTNKKILKSLLLVSSFLLGIDFIANVLK